MKKLSLVFLIFFGFGFAQAGKDFWWMNNPSIFSSGTSGNSQQQQQPQQVVQQPQPVQQPQGYPDPQGN